MAIIIPGKEQGSGIPKSASLLSKYFSSPGAESKLSSSEQRMQQQMRSFKEGINRLSNDGHRVFANNISRFAPEIRNPLLQSENFYLPQQTTRTGAPNVELNRWLSYYYKYDPLIGNLVDLHSELPLSRFGFQGVEDPTILQFYEEMAEDMDLFMAMVNLLKCWFLFGEAMPYFFWNTDLNRFDQVTYLDTSYVEVFSHSFFHNTDGNPTTLYSLIPDPLLVDLIQNTHPKVQELIVNNLPPEMIIAVTENKPLILHNFNTEIILRQASPWDVRGTSIVIGCLKELLYQDKLREAQYAISEGHINPIFIWKLGQPGEYMPLTEDITAFRDVILSMNNDPVRNLVTHYAVNLQVEGAAGRILPIVPEIQFVENRILIRMFSNRALISSEGVTFNNASVALRTLMSRYIPIRAMAENLIYRKVFLPVALANSFFKRKKSDLAHNVRTSTDELVIPQFNWSHKQNLLDDSNIKSMLMQLRTATEIPMKTICDAFDLDYDEVKSFLQREEGTILDPAVRNARTALIGATQQDPADTPKTFWEKFIKKLAQWRIPSSEEQLQKVAEVAPDEPALIPQNGKPNAPIKEEGEAPPAVPGATEIPEEAATPDEVPNVETPLGASKRVTKDAKKLGINTSSWNERTALKQVSKYFKEGSNALDTERLKQFDFLRGAVNNIESYSQLRSRTVYCPKCDWAQTMFVDPLVATAVKEENWELVGLDGEKLDNFKTVFNNLHWKTEKEYNEDKHKLCPNCKQSTVEVKSGG